MSDRRSFSEIPAEALRDHGEQARVERVWARLHSEDAARPADSRHPSVLGGILTVAVVTFAAGFWFGSRATHPMADERAAVHAEPRPAAALASAPNVRSVGAPATETAPGQPRAPRRASLGRPSGAEPEAHLPSIVAAASVAPPQQNRWHALADEGQYPEALAALDALGGFDAVLHQATADELMSLVDVARATGQRDRAILALRRIVAEHGADPNAPVAAWMLGNELAKARSYGEAEQAFAMYRALSPNGDFAEDALSRQVDMAEEQGHLDHAKVLAEKYLKEFPDGPRSDEVRAALERWSHALVASQGAAASTRLDGGLE